MTKQKSTKRTLLMSGLALLMCVSMLIGSTFAWFTDSVTSGVNKIIAGNLDIGVYYAYPSDVKNGDIPEEEWKPVTAEDLLFNNDALWEPGYTEAVFLKFVNEGTLALQYQLQVDILDEVLGKTKDGADIQLSKYINAYACNSFTWDYQNYLFTERDDATNPAGAPDPYYDTLYNAANGELNTPNNEYPLSMDSWQWLAPEETTYATLVLWMPTTVGNEANHDGENVPHIDLGVTVLATQYTYESDSFGNDYDADAEYQEPATSVATFKELKAALEKGGNIELANDIAFTEMITIPAGVEVYLDMNEKTITPASAEVDPLLDVKTGAALVIDGNGTFDLGNNYGMSLMYPRGDVTINSGTFKIGANGTTYGSMFVGINGGQGKLIINGGYFDGGYYKEYDCFNNCRNLLNGSWGQYIRVYGGTFVGQNPAWGDEGMAFLCPHCTHTSGQGYCQALFLEGQSREDTELPAGYTITEGTTDDGRPTYTVTYSK